MSTLSSRNSGCTPPRRRDDRCGAVSIHELDWLRVAASLRNFAFHLLDKPHLRGTDSIGEGWVARELETLRDLAATLET